MLAGRLDRPSPALTMNNATVPTGTAKDLLKYSHGRGQPGYRDQYGGVSSRHGFFCARDLSSKVLHNVMRVKNGPNSPVLMKRIVKSFLPGASKPRLNLSASYYDSRWCGIIAWSPTVHFG